MTTKTQARLQAQIEKLRAQIEKEKAKERDRTRKALMSDIVRKMHAFEITPKDLVQALAELPASRRTKAVSKAKVKTKNKARTRAKVAPKYRSHNGELWSGRGHAPRWLTEAEANGVPRTMFLIEAPETPAAPSASVDASHQDRENQPAEGANAIASADGSGTQSESVGAN